MLWEKFQNTDEFSDASAHGLARVKEISHYNHIQNIFRASTVKTLHCYLHTVKTQRQYSI